MSRGVPNGTAPSLHSSLTALPAPDSRAALEPKVREARRLAAFVNEVYAEMTRKWRFVPGTDRVVRARPMRLREAWAAALRPGAQPIDDLETIVGVNDILRAQRARRPTVLELLTPAARIVPPRESQVDHVLSLVASRETRDPDDLVPTEGDAAHPWKGPAPVVKKPRVRRGAAKPVDPAAPPPHPLAKPVLAQLARRDRTADAIAWELGEAPLDVDDALLQLEQASRVERVPGDDPETQKWRMRR